ncbi:hypothetical protein TbrSNM41_11630 [Thermus brockianus]|uniref:Transposase n=1 Tax=Thermus brockianus TaxID=56956 RepID=A0ABN6NJ15_THEBO|nr:hypothetical protein TbrSNM41_11630 [Thermus brockianus]
MQAGYKPRHGHLAHHLHATRKHPIRHPRHDSLSRHGNGLQTRRAKAVNGGTRYLYWEACPQKSQPRDVKPLSRFWNRTTPKDILQLPWIQANTLHRPAHHLRRKIHRVQIRKSAVPLSPPNRAPHRTDNDRLTHFPSP